MIRGLGRYTRQDDDTAELGFVVKEDYQSHGIGNYLCECLVRAAQRHGLKKLFAYVSRSNIVMLRILEKHGFTAKESKRVEGYYCVRNITPEKGVPLPFLDKAEESPVPS